MYVYVYMCRHVYMSMNVCPCVHISRLYVLHDYVQRCEDTVSVEWRYININQIIVIIIIIIIIIIIVVVVVVC